MELWSFMLTFIGPNTAFKSMLLPNVHDEPCFILLQQTTCQREDHEHFISPWSHFVRSEHRPGACIPLLPYPNPQNERGSLNVIQCFTRSPNAAKHASACVDHHDELFLQELHGIDLHSVVKQATMDQLARTTYATDSYCYLDNVFKTSTLAQKYCTYAAKLSSMLLPNQPL